MLEKIHCRLPMLSKGLYKLLLAFLGGFLFGVTGKPCLPNNGLCHFFYYLLLALGGQLLSSTLSIQAA
jgi:hypothetical protein